MSLRWRFALILAGSAVLVSAAAGAAAIWSTNQVLNREADAFLAERVEVVRRIPTEQLAALADGRRLQIPGFGDRGRGVFDGGRGGVVSLDSVFQINTVDGDVLSAIQGQPIIPPAPATEILEPVAYRDVTVDDRPHRVVAVALRDGLQLQIARDTSDIAAILAGLRGRIIGAGTLIAVVAAAAGWMMARRTVRPVERLSEAARTVAATQELTAPIEVTTQGEVGQLAESFNTMLAALRNSREQQHRLVMDASHELRTPLTSLRTNIEVLQRADALPTDERTALLRDVDMELQELTGLVEELVDLATDQRADEAVEPLDLGTIAETVAERYRRRTDRTIHVTADRSPVLGRPNQLDRAVSNLVDNATKWSPADGDIWVIVAQGRITVIDSGRGFHERDLDQVFDRFYRSDEARTMPGSGLGLAIVRQIVEAHDGRVFAANSADNGAEVGFEIPLSPMA